MKGRNKTALTSWQVAATYIGTIVGAGFASGQEMLQFFGAFGIWGLMGLALAGYLFYYFGNIILQLGKELKAESHVPVIYYAGGPYLGRFIDYVITFFLFGALTAMAAGAGAVFLEQFGLSPLVGNGMMLLLTLATVLLGLAGVISAISFTVPVLLLAIMGISLFFGFSQGSGMLSLQALGGSPAVPFWPLAAVIYVSYNLVMAVAILGPLANEAQSSAILKKGALWGGIGLAVSTFLIYIAVLGTLPESVTYRVPMIYAAGRISPLVRQIYSLVLVIEIYTTAVGSLYGFIVRVAPSRKKGFRIAAALGTSLAAFAASQLGFTTLVRYLYPLVGYAGVMMLGGLLYCRGRERGFVPGLVFRPEKKGKKGP